MAGKRIKELHFQSAESRRLGALAAVLMDDDAIKEKIREGVDDDFKKLQLLCRHYRIVEDETMFFNLSLALARELYPEPKQAGRKAKWTPLNQGALVVEIERLIKPNDKSHGITWACKQLAKKEPWASFVEQRESDNTTPDPAESLRQIYSKFKNNKWADVLRDNFRFYEQNNKLNDWNAQVTDLVKNPHPK